MHGITSAISRLATRSNGVVTIDQLRDLGASDDRVRHLTQTGFLHRRRRGVYVVGHCAMSREARWREALLAAGPGATIAGFAAARIWRFGTERSERVDIIVPTPRRGIADVRTHVTRLPDTDHTTRRGFDVTSVARTMLDLARIGVSADALTYAFHEAAYQEVLDLRDIDDVLNRHRGARGTRAMRDATNAHRAGRRGTRSAFERRVATYLGGCGAPRPELGVPLQVNEDTFEVDLWWAAHQLVVEVDGPGHDRPAARRHDAHRALALERAGIRLIRITLDAFQADPVRAVRPILDVIGSRTR